MRAVAILILSIFIFTFQALAANDPLTVRWTGKDDPNPDFLHIVSVLNGKTSAQVAPTDFILFEDTHLATSRFRTYLQVAGGLPIQGRSLRTWTDLGTGQVVQVEAMVEAKPTVNILTLKAGRYAYQDPQFVQERTMQIVRAVVKAHRDDPNIRSILQTDEWFRGETVRTFRVKGKRGTHTIRVRLDNFKLLQHNYREFPQADAAEDETSVPVRVYPIYEEQRGIIQTRVLSQLRHLKKNVAHVTADPYGDLRIKRYFEDQMDSVLGATPEGQAQGKWSMPDVKMQAALIRANLPLADNSFAAGGVILEGRYADVSLHPDAAKLKGVQFPLGISAQFMPNWNEVKVSNETKNEMVPGGSLLGRPLSSYEDAFDRPARRLENHDPVSYLNDGFDEVQVYWAIDTLMDTLHSMGFTDTELSTRPFHAFLYNPDVSMKDNAFYTDDTINFTTYSPKAMNFARDNSTIWHELGHGVMDRLMGDLITLNDSGGLSEGMADFVASLVIAKVTNGVPFAGMNDFRIVNNTGFFLTNEAHDDGEAYGGTMYDLLNAARAQYGELGTIKVADLTMEAMRLSRNHPALTAPDWFNHMLFADERGNPPLRAPGELTALINKALAGRNFQLDPSKAAQFELLYNDKPVGPNDLGSRAKPIRVPLKATETAKYTLKVSAKESAQYSFHYPLTVKVAFTGGAIQGAIHWVGKEKGDRTYTLKGPDDVLNIDLEATGVCDEINRPDGSCVDYASIQLFVGQLLPAGLTKPVGKKRFYLRIAPQP